MNTKDIFYSCCTWLSFQICENYFGNVHYIWCTPYYDPPSRLNPYNSVPPTSSPKDIYWGLRREIDAGDRHSAKILQNRTGIQRGADVKLKAGVINADQHTEILEIISVAEPRDFRPMIYVIPAHAITTLLKPVAVKDRAHIMSEEYIIKSLPRKLFNAIEP